MQILHVIMPYITHFFSPRRQELAHPTWKRCGSHLFVEKSISLWQAPLTPPESDPDNGQLIHHWPDNFYKTNPHPWWCIGYSGDMWSVHKDPPRWFQITPLAQGCSCAQSWTLTTSSYFHAKLRRSKIQTCLDNMIQTRHLSHFYTYLWICYRATQQNTWKQRNHWNSHWYWLTLHYLDSLLSPCQVLRSSDEKSCRERYQFWIPRGTTCIPPSVHYSVHHSTTKRKRNLYWLML